MEASRATIAAAQRQKRAASEYLLAREIGPAAEDDTQMIVAVGEPERKRLCRCDA
jgi:hypothetical protein